MFYFCNKPTEFNNNSLLSVETGTFSPFVPWSTTVFAFGHNTMASRPERLRAKAAQSGLLASGGGTLCVPDRCLSRLEPSDHEHEPNRLLANCFRAPQCEREHAIV